jgi:ribonuclease P protein component
MSNKLVKLKNNNTISILFKEGKSINNYPFRLIYLIKEEPKNDSFFVSIAKKKFKKAVDRNRIKRLMRETYRLQKQIVYKNLDTPYVFMISYLGKEEWSYEDLFQKMEKLLTLFINEVKTKENE